MKCVGYELKEGTYQGRAYSNVVLHLLKANNDRVFGVCTDTVKVKKDLLMPLIKNSFSNIMEHDIEIFYNRYGQVADVKIKN